MIEFLHDLGRWRRAPVAATPAALWPTFCVVFAACFVVYLPAAFDAQLLQFDDNFFFGPDNPEFRAGFGAVATQPIANAYLPVAHLSLWFDYVNTGTAPFWPHLHSLLLHAFAGVVLVRLLLQLGVGRLAAHVVGVCFAVHPALAESVAWVSSRKDVLSGLFVFAALHQVARFAHRPSAWRAGLLAVLAAAAMYAKPTAVVLPLLAGGVAAWTGGPRGRWWGPLVVLLVTVPIALQHREIAAAEGTLAAGAVDARLAQVPGVFWHYLTTAVWPTRLNVLYPEVDTLARCRGAWLPGALALAGVALLVAFGWRWPRARPIAAGMAAFVAALLPFNTAYPASSIAAADRYLYLAIPGLALAVVALATALHARCGPWLAAALALPLAWLAGGRARDFADDTTLWQSSLAVEPVNAVAHFDLATALWNAAVVAGRPLPVDAIEPHLRAAIDAARYPVHELRARRQLVAIELQRADYAAAAADAEAAIAAAAAQRALETTARRIALADEELLRARLAAFEPLQLHGDGAAADAVLAAAQAMAPEHPDVIAFAAVRGLAALQDELLGLARAGKPPRLAEDDPRGAAVDAALAAARERHPGHAGLWLAQAEWDRARDRAMPALRAYLEAQKLRPDSVDAWLGAARLLRDRGNWEGAARHARNGLAQRPDPRLRQELALALVGLNRFDEAELQLEAYLKLFPEDRDSAKILASLLIGRAYTLLSDRGARADVRRIVDRALAYNPNEAKAHLVLGRLAREERRFASAVEHLEQAVRLLPAFDDARLQLAEALAALGYDRLLRKDDEGASDAWQRCVAVAPPGFDVGEVRTQLRLAWQRFEARGVERLAAGERALAIADFRRCLAIDPEQHWAAWLLATALQPDPDADLDELERLCRLALAWQQRHGLDGSQQVYLLATTLAKKGDAAAAQRLAQDYLTAPAADARPQVLTALRRIAGG